jgi:hypothetical protein
MKPLNCWYRRSGHGEGRVASHAYRQACDAAALHQSKKAVEDSETDRHCMRHGQPRVRRKEAANRGRHVFDVFG